MKKCFISLALTVFLTLGALCFYADAAGSIAVETGSGFIKVDYSKVFGGTCNSVPSATTEKNVVFDGVNSVKVTPAPDTAGDNMLNLDSWDFPNLSTGVTLPDYKYIGVTYYCASDNPTYIGKMKMSILGGGKSALKSTVSAYSREKIVCGKWKEAYFDFGSLYEMNPDASTDILGQIHFFPFGDTKAAELSSSDVIYIAKFSFYTSNPDPVTVDDNSISVDYSFVSGGICNRKPTAAAEKHVDFGGINTLKVTPTPLTGGSTAINLDAWTFGGLREKIILPDYKFVGVTYYYDTDNPTYTGKMKMNILGGGTYSLKDTVSASSGENIVCNKWTEALFAFGERYEMGDDPEKNYLNQIHFFPFGDVHSSNLKESDVIYIAKFTFYKKNPNPDALYSAVFQTSNPDAEGELPDTILHKDGENYTLPECTMTLKNGTFLGWMSSLDGEMHSPGEVIEGNDLNAWYTAMWEIVYKTDADVISLDYTEYENGIINHTDGAYLYENTELDGMTAVKVIPNPESSRAKTLGLDGYTYAGAAVNLAEFRWFVVTYKYESPTPVNTRMRVTALTNGNVLTKSYSALSEEPLKVGEWAFAVFDMTALGDLLKPGYSHNLRQMHIYPLNYTPLTSLTTDDVLYISRVSFFKERPDGLTLHLPYVSGFKDGTFKYNKYMTRAEACTAVAKALESDSSIKGTSPFSDVSGDAWYSKYIGYCFENGITDEKGGAFRPNDFMTRREFISLAMNAFSNMGGGGVGDVIPNGGEYIKRGETVEMLNALSGRNAANENLDGSFYAVFFDVRSADHNFATIAEAAVAHVELSDGKWAYTAKSPEKDLADSSDTDYTVGNSKIAEIDRLSDARKKSILESASDLSTITGKTYYISPNGNDSADGLSPATAWKTIDKLKGAALGNGDGVLFERGGLFRGKFSAVSGVTYSAYGTGDKPKIYGSPLNAADPALWTLDYEEPESGKKIWLYTGEDLVDVGAITFDEEVYTYKEVPSYQNGMFVVRGKSIPFDYRTHLTKNYSYVHLADSVISNGIPSGTATGKIYLRCDDGNPGELYDDIEFNTKGNIISMANGATFDNLCIMFGGSHGIGGGTTNNITVKNCVLGWIGGSIQHYQSSGVVTRFGNGVEIYGGCDGYTIENCYVYQNYDAGITHQYGSANVEIHMDNIVYRGNLIEDCVYNIEYFLGTSDKNFPHDGKNILIEDNILRRAGYGFGSTRPDGGAQAHIKSWDSGNAFTNYVIRNNIFDRSTWRLLHLSATYKAYMPKMEGNTYIQGYGNYFVQYGISGSKPYSFDLGAEKLMREMLGDETGEVYFVNKIPAYVFPFGDGIVKTAE